MCSTAARISANGPEIAIHDESAANADGPPDPIGGPAFYFVIRLA